MGPDRLPAFQAVGDWLHAHCYDGDDADSVDDPFYIDNYLTAISRLPTTLLVGWLEEVGRIRRDEGYMSTGNWDFIAGPNA